MMLHKPIAHSRRQLLFMINLFFITSILFEFPPINNSVRAATLSLVKVLLAKDKVACCLFHLRLQRSTTSGSADGWAGFIDIPHAAAIGGVRLQKLNMALASVQHRHITFATVTNRKPTVACVATAGRIGNKNLAGVVIR